LHEFICDDCRFHHYKKEDWIIEGPRKLEKYSVIRANHYDANTVELPTIFEKLDNKKWETI